MADSDTTGDKIWGSITSASTDNLHFTINKDFDNIKFSYEATDKKVSLGRKKLLCNGCGNAYFEGDGITGKFCSLDCKYARCEVEEETEDED